MAGAAPRRGRRALGAGGAAAGALAWAGGLAGAAGAAGAGRPAGVAVVAGGVLAPAEQYASYAGALAGAGCVAAVVADGGGLARAQGLEAGARGVLERADAEAAAAGLSGSAPLVLVGHSRGAKTCVAAAAASQRPVAALVLLDPVDATGPDPSSALPALRGLADAVPTAVLGAAAGNGDCNQKDYQKFADVLDSAGAPRLLGVLERAGHLQFVDNRRMLPQDPCTPGRDSDAAVREVALAAAAAWAGAALGPDPRRARRAAAAALAARPFEAAVSWRAADL